MSATIHPASRGMKIRLAAVTLAVAGMATVIALTAHTSWSRTSELRERLTDVQLQSFLIADHFQQTILGLNNLMLRYGVYRERKDWERFEVESKKLDDWIDNQRDILNTEKEKHILDLIATNYDGYMAAAREVEVKAREPVATTPLAQFAEFEKQSKEILSLAFRLAAAHRESMDSFLADSKRSVNYLRTVLLSSLALLLLAGAGLALVIYRDLIAPLRVKLVESQALMERQEKLASLGMLAAGVAHEIRNPLTAIKAWLFIQQKQLQAGTAEYDDAQIIAGEINRLERIVKDVLLFGRPSEPHLATIKAEEPLREVQALLAAELEKSNIRLTFEDSIKAEIRADPQQIKQVLINLVQNAAESIGRNGTVTLRARESMKRLAEGDKSVIILEVADNGKGIPPEVEKRLFDPFFTTKESGTGLGLSIAARIVQMHGGALQYQTQVSRGTTFGIVLPALN
jgi:signal transduction histidine kinase